MEYKEELAPEGRKRQSCPPSPTSNSKCATQEPVAQASQQRQVARKDAIISLSLPLARGAEQELDVRGGAIS